MLYNLSFVLVLIQHAAVNYRLRKEIHSTIAKPTALLDITLDDQTIESLASDLVNIEKPAVVPVAARQINRMDISRIARSQAPVKPAAWVYERNKKHAIIVKQTKVFSDITRAPRINRNLVLQ